MQSMMRTAVMTMMRKAIAIKFQARENQQGGFQNIDAMITILLPLQFDF